jgi:predicted nucleotidyltransferase
MDSSEIQLSHNHQAVTNRFVAACQADERVIAAFLGGSYARGAADTHSDLDLYLVTTDEAYEAFCAQRESFIRLLGEPAFLEDFGASHGLFYIFSDGTEGELWIGRESHFKHIHGGAYTVLLDKQGLLRGVDFPMHEADPAEQVERLRQLIMVFWHDLLHFVKALDRGQLWFAYGELEVLRRMCINLARLRHNFADPGVGDEPHFKIEDAMPVEQLAPLQATYCPMEPEAMLQAARVIFRFYQELAPPLAQTHGIPYPADLERVMVARLEELGGA